MNDLIGEFSAGWYRLLHPGSTPADYENFLNGTDDRPSLIDSLAKAGKVVFWLIVLVLIIWASRELRSWFR